MLKKLSSEARFEERALRDAKTATAECDLKRVDEKVEMVIGFLAAFGCTMALMQVAAKATHFFFSVAGDKYQLLLMINTPPIALGTFMDMAPMILICTPILPVVMKFGIPVHFGMILPVNSGIGLLPPPVGPTLFVGCAIGKVTTAEVSRELWPCYAAMCMAQPILIYVPAVSLWLPHLPSK